MRRKPRSHWLLQLMVTSHQRWSNHVTLTLLSALLKTYMNITSKGSSPSLTGHLDSTLTWCETACSSSSQFVWAVEGELQQSGVKRRWVDLAARRERRPQNNDTGLQLDCVLSFRASLQTSGRSGTGMCWRESWPRKFNISSYQGLLMTQLHLFRVTCFYLYSHQPRNW